MHESCSPVPCHLCGRVLPVVLPVHRWPAGGAVQRAAPRRRPPRRPCGCPARRRSARPFPIPPPTQPAVLDTMADVLEAKIADLQGAVAKQGDTVRSLKASAKDGNAEKVRCSWRLGSRGWAPDQPGRRPCPRPCSPPALSSSSAPQADVDAAIAKLQELKIELDGAQKVRSVARSTSRCALQPGPPTSARCACTCACAPHEACMHLSCMSVARSHAACPWCTPRPMRSRLARCRRRVARPSAPRW